MNVPVALVTAIAEGAETHHELPMEPWVYPIIAGVLFFVLFLATYAFRNVASKH